MAPTRYPMLWRRAIAAMCCAWLLVSCGGGVDSGGTGSYASGPITGLGSIIVGGVDYDESTAEVRDDTGLRSRDDLKLGMVTDIEATTPDSAASMPTATATTVRFRSEIVGPVDVAPNSATGTLQVLGQTIKIGQTTVFDTSFIGGLAGVHVADVVEIYGQYDAQSLQYTATRIDRAASTVNAYKLRGPVTALDTDLKTLVIGRQSIAYGAVDPLPALALGQTLRVTLKTWKSGVNWVATTVSDGVTQLPDRDSVHVEGRITKFSSLYAFEVDGTPVVTTASTVLPTNAATVLVLGARVEVRGSSAGGVVTATRIDIEDDAHVGTAPIKISGTISLLDAGAPTFVVRGVTISYASATFSGGATATNLRVGRKVEILGALASDGSTVVASKIQYDD